MGTFAEDTAVEAAGPGRYRGEIGRGWWIARGPNGGLLAAIVLRAIQVEVGDPQRRPRTLTLHYLRPPGEGACEVAVTVERAGRGLTTATARLEQDGRTCVLAIAALGADRPGPELHDALMPTVPSPDDLEAPHYPPGAPQVPIRNRYEMRPCLGSAPFASGPAAVTGGWIRTAAAEPVDDVVLAALADAWPPAIFSRLQLPVGVPTIELTVHFRAKPTEGQVWSLVRFESREAGAGFLEEVGEIWSPDGRLLAESRQLAVLLPPG